MDHMSERFEYQECDENDEWIVPIVSALKEMALDRNFAPFKLATFLDDDCNDILPVRFIQPIRTLIVFHRQSFTVDAYKECIKLFAYSVDAYYITHQNYYTFLDSIKGLQASMHGSPFHIAIISDLMDVFYTTVMSGKYAIRIKGEKTNEASLGIMSEDIREAYRGFTTNPFLALGAACVNTVLKNFYEVDFGITAPEYQSARIVLQRVEEIVKDAVTSIGSSATYELAFRFFGIANVFINSDVSDIKIPK